MTEISKKGTAVPTATTFLYLSDFTLIGLGVIVLAILILAGEALTLPAVLALPFGILRLLLGTAYILYLPGYCLTEMLFPARAHIDGIERIGLSLGLSVAWVPVIALVLDRLPWGLRLWPIFLGQLLAILLFSAGAFYRRTRQPVGQAHITTASWRIRPWWRSLPLLDRRIYLLSAGALLVAGLAAGFIFLVPADDEFMTEFYILGPAGIAEDFPRETAVGESLTTTMGITNQEREPQTYRVEIWAVDLWNEQRQQVGAAGPVTLAPTETAEQTVAWAMPWSGQDQIVEFFLFTTAQIEFEPYRQLRLWLDVTVE